MDVVVVLLVVLLVAALAYALFAFGVFGSGLARSRDGDKDGARSQPPGPTRNQER